MWLNLLTLSSVLVADAAARTSIVREIRRRKDQVATVQKTLSKEIQSVDQRLEAVKSSYCGPIFEQDVKEDYHYVFGDFLGVEAHPFPKQHLVSLADIALEGGTITSEEKKEAMGSDVVGSRGFLKQKSGRHLIVAEVSIKIMKTDVRRAAQRATLWGKIFNIDAEHRVIAAVVGRKGSKDTESFAAAQGVQYILIDKEED